MKIQEMRSGIPKITSKEDLAPRNNVFEMRSTERAAPDNQIVPEAIGELEMPTWSVVSFDQCQAGGLTYRQAADLMAELSSYDIAGLCIITDQAASRLSD